MCMNLISPQKYETSRGDNSNNEVTFKRSCSMLTCITLTL